MRRAFSAPIDRDCVYFRPSEGRSLRLPRSPRPLRSRERDLVRVVLRDGRAADHNPGLTASASACDGIHRSFIAGMVVVEKRGHSNQFGAIVYGFHKFLGLCVHSEVHNFISGSLEHHSYEVLADVVEVALHCADCDLAFRLMASAASFGRSSSIELFIARAAIRTSGT